MSLKPFRRLLCVAVAFVALTALAPSTAGATTTPAVGYAQFTGCPHPGQMTIEFCFRTDFTGGLLQMGNVEIPIANPITLSGGITPGGAVGFNSFGGLAPVMQTVPGGIVGLAGIPWLPTVLGMPEQEVHARIELAGTPGNPLESGSLPVRVHLMGTALGNTCYIGSIANPISLQLITGTTSPPPPNSPITGMEPEISETPNSVVDFTNGTYVDNSFAAPGVEGCTLVLPPLPPVEIDELIEAQSGLPAAAGPTKWTWASTRNSPRPKSCIRKRHALGRVHGTLGVLRLDSCRPETLPGCISCAPVVSEIEQAEPGGVSCRKRSSSLTWWSCSARKPARST